jgi:hypothetical protein
MKFDTLLFASVDWFEELLQPTKTAVDDVVSRSSTY